jgi:hypothetical protein
MRHIMIFYNASKGASCSHLGKIVCYNLMVIAAGSTGSISQNTASQSLLSRVPLR